MTDPTTDRSELLLRYSRRSMFVSLVFILAMGSVAMAIRGLLPVEPRFSAAPEPSTAENSTVSSGCWLDASRS